MEDVPLQDELAELVGEQVVLDVKDPHLYIGTLARVGRHVIVLQEADVHYCGDSLTTTELYLVQTRRTGVRANRKEVFVLRDEVVSISRLADVVDY